MDRLVAEELRSFTSLDAHRNGHSRDDGWGDGDGGHEPSQQGWSLLPAIVVAILVAALLTLFGMWIQILANMAGAQLPAA